MKLYFFILSLFCCSQIFSQTKNLGNYAYSAPNIEANFNQNIGENANAKTFANYLKTYTQCIHCEFVMIDKSESLAGNHYTFQVYFNNLPIENCLAKIHTSATNTIYKISHNLPEVKNWSTPSKANFSINFDDYKEIAKVVSANSTIVLNNYNLPIVAEKIIFINEAQSIYKQRIYTSANVFYETDLRSFSNDTIIHGKVFMPDPLTTSGEFYGGNYVDGLKKDTSIILVASFLNTNQNPFSTNDINFTFNNQTFSVAAQNFANTYTADSVFLYLTEIITNNQGIVLGYNAALIGDKNLVESKVIIEDFDFPELLAEQQWQSTNGNYTAGKFRLTNNYFEITDFSLPFIAPAESFNDTFSFKRSEFGFENYNAFFHLNNYRNYIENLGFNSLFRWKIFVDTHGNNGADNSFYVHVPIFDTISINPLVIDTVSLNRLVFGNGGVDDAEDADVVVHEYGHALSFMAAPFSNFGAQRRALDEGYGDYLAASYSRNFSDHQWENVFTWDGHNEFWAGRKADLNRNFEEVDTSKSIYFNGEIWSSMLMELWGILGRETTDKLAIQTMYFNMPNGTFANAAQNLLLSDSLLFGFSNRCEIYNVLFNRKFVVQFCVGGQLLNTQGLFVLNSQGFLDNSSNTTIIIGDKNLTTFDAYMTDISGKKVWELKSSSEKSFEVSSANLPSGVYIIRVNTNNKKYETKLLKVKN